MRNASFRTSSPTCGRSRPTRMTSHGAWRSWDRACSPPSRLTSNSAVTTTSCLAIALPHRDRRRSNMEPTPLETFVRDYVETAGGVWDEVEPEVYDILLPAGDTAP